MGLLTGLLLIVFGAPLVGLLGNALAGTGRRSPGRPASAPGPRREPGGRRLRPRHPLGPLGHVKALDGR
ncbi:hypothetical protein ACWERI_12100 [Streptomyces collinus]|uniref:hypothetical protein n=1 Tax=Streptomyces collinus TaxID=42684 RepID=UPI0036A5C9DF